MSSGSEDEAPAAKNRNQRAVFALPKKKAANVVFYTHFEEVLQKINPFGPYQIYCCIVILYASIEWTGNSTFMFALGSLEPDWNCTMPDGRFETVEAPTTDDKCKILTTQCSNFTAIHKSVEFRSLVSDFKLVCDDKDKIKWIEVCQAGGSLVGSIFGGHMGDHFGRKYIFFSGQLLIIITSIMSTAARSWIAFACIMVVNCFLYGIIEVTSLTLMMEYTSNKFRTIHANAFQQPFAYMVIALIAFLTKDWQNFFIFLNLVACPLAIGFMLFLESPRWLIARNKLDKACDVLNDIAHQRWNNTKAKFTTRDLSSIPKTKKKQPFYNFYHLFSTGRLAKQSFMQITSMFTYAMVSNTYFYTVQGMHTSVIMFTFLDGVFRLFTPFIIIFLDLKFPKFGRKMQFVGSLLIEFLLYAAVIIMVALGIDYQSDPVRILVIIATMVNDCIFWINIVQITTQRYPTVIRCIAFGCLHSIKHAGTIFGFLFLRDLIKTDTWLAFAIPEACILFNLVVGFFFQPETKGKALMDQMVEANYGRLENELPRALMRLAAGHKVQQIVVREQLKNEFAEALKKEKEGEKVHNPFIFHGDETPLTEVDRYDLVPLDDEPNGEENRGFESDEEEYREGRYRTLTFDHLVGGCPPSMQKSVQTPMQTSIHM